MNKVSVVVKITAKDGRADDIIAAFAGAKSAVDAEEGTEMYVLHQSLTDPNQLFVTEWYTDQAALDAHMAGEAIKALGGVGDAIESIDMQFTKPVVGL